MSSGLVGFYVPGTSCGIWEIPMRFRCILSYYSSLLANFCKECTKCSVHITLLLPYCLNDSACLCLAVRCTDTNKRVWVARVLVPSRCYQLRARPLLSCLVKSGYWCCQLQGLSTSAIVREIIHWNNPESAEVAQATWSHSIWRDDLRGFGVNLYIKLFLLVFRSPVRWRLVLT
jgi:hypothetical protein